MTLQILILKQLFVLSKHVSHYHCIFTCGNSKRIMTVKVAVACFRMTKRYFCDSTQPNLVNLNWIPITESVAKDSISHKHTWTILYMIMWFETCHAGFVNFIISNTRITTGWKIWWFTKSVPCKLYPLDSIALTSYYINKIYIRKLCTYEWMYVTINEILLVTQLAIAS